MAPTPQEKPLWAFYVAATEKIDSLANQFNESIKWLKEMQDEIKKSFGSENISLLPKTPHLKRKRTENVTSSNSHEDQSILPNNPHSTFVDGVKNKKLKIDDISRISEEPDTSILNESKRSLRLRNRQKRSSQQPVRKSKRKKNISKVYVKDTPSPNKTNIEKTLKEISPLVIVSPLCHDTSHIVQPRVAALIEKLKNSGKKTSQISSKICDNDDSVKGRLTFDDDCEVTIEDKVQTQKRDEDESNKMVKNLNSTTVINETITSSPFACSLQKASTPDLQSPVEKQSDKRYHVNNDLSQDEEMDIDNDGSFTHDNNDSENKHSTIHDKEATQKTFILEDENQENVKNQINQETVKCNIALNEAPSEKIVKPPARSSDSGVSSDENNQAELVVSKKEEILKKPTANSKEELKKDASMLPPKNIASGIQSFVKSTDGFKKPPVEANWHGNIATGIKSFLSKTNSPKRETEEEKQKKKIAELKKREELRQKAIKQQYIHKQKLVENRKRMREEKEKRFAEQKAKKLEEEERKKELLNMKQLQIAKNQEEIRRLREKQEQKKRELREFKQNEAEKKRLREEEEQKRKALDQIQEENRRAEMLQRKAEHEEQERQRKRLEQEKNERERLRQIEEERLLHEERKKREFEEKEQHRLLVEKKQKEEKEKERMERLQKEERLKEAEKLIQEAKKREIEREKEKNRERLREEIKTNLAQGKALKGECKVVINAAKTTRNSPRFQGKENFKAPGANTAGSVKSPAAYHPPITKMKKVFNPPKVPMRIRESSFTSYGIDDLSSEDSTDDESQPAKRIPSWAKGRDLQVQLLAQFYTNIDPDDIFTNCLGPCKLEEIFQKRKERYFKRTSSAHWTSPILKTMK